MKLLLDEMISFRIATELRVRGHDVVAVKRDRPDLESVPDHQIVEVLAAEQRVIVTNNVHDYRPIHDARTSAGKGHAGIIFTFDAVLPRNRAAIPLWVDRLDELLTAHPKDNALQSRTLALI